MAKTNRIVYPGTLPVAVLIAVVFITLAMLTKVLLPMNSTTVDDSPSNLYLGDHIPLTSTSQVEMGDLNINVGDGWSISGITQQPADMGFVVNSNLSAKLVVVNNNNIDAKLTSLYLSTPNWVKRDLDFVSQAQEEFTVGETVVTLNTEKFYAPPADEASSTQTASNIYAQVYGCLNTSLCLTITDLSRLEEENKQQIEEFKQLLQVIATQV